jgi:hypothetical protein
VAGALQRFLEHGAQLRFVFDQEQGFHQFFLYHEFKPRSDRPCGLVRSSLSGEY